ncbi:MAG: hypothetical protein GEU88_19625 [Solirubrobacterales bacterium]|nr:hypothetical protein [Solirubrobacterales bacterium]
MEGFGLTTIAPRLAGVGLALLALAPLAALKAAGLTGSAPAKAGALEQFVSTISDNALWIIGTVAVLSVLVIGGLFFFGHSRAQDYAMKVGGGAIIIILAPGIAA